MHTQPNISTYQQYNVPMRAGRNDIRMQLTDILIYLHTYIRSGQHADRPMYYCMYIAQSYLNFKVTHSNNVTFQYVVK